MKNLRKKSSGKGGFTLIEILVVMAIIGILLATAVPAIIGQIQKQKENASAAKAHNLAIACFTYSNDNNQTYPSGTTSTLAFTSLYNGKYLTQPGDIYLGSKSITSSEQGYQPTAAFNSWDLVAESNSQGLTGTDPTDIPLVFSVVVTPPSLISNGPLTAKIDGTCPWGFDGVTVCTLGQQASFVRPGATAGVVNLSSSSYAPPANSTYVTLTP